MFGPKTADLTQPPATMFPPAFRQNTEFLWFRHGTKNGWDARALFSVSAVLAALSTAFGTLEETHRHYLDGAVTADLPTAGSICLARAISASPALSSPASFFIEPRR